MTIRLAERADAEAVAAIFLGSRRRYVAFAPLAHSEAEVRRWIQDRLIGQKRVWVLEEGAVRAFIALSTSDEGSWIEQLYVHPDLTGRGYGKALLELAKVRLRAPVFVYTFQENIGARRFYERAGFKSVKLSDGTGNEECCPDVLYCWDGLPNEVSKEG